MPKLRWATSSPTHSSPEVPSVLNNYESISRNKPKCNPHIVCVYEYSPIDSLNIKEFPEMSDEWLDFMADCRHGVTHNYDIVEGPMADDEVWDYVEDFLSGRISREAFWALARLKHPTHQILFCNDKALTSLTFISHYVLGTIYIPQKIGFRLMMCFSYVS